MTDKAVYLSYVARDASYAEPIRELLQRQLGLEVIASQDASSSADIHSWIADRLGACKALVVVVGETTYQSSFVEIEARMASALNKPVVVLKLAPENITPSVLYDGPSLWTDVRNCESVLVSVLGERMGQSR